MTLETRLYPGKQEPRHYNQFYGSSVKTFCTGLCDSFLYVLGERKMAVLDDKFSRSLTLLKDLRPGTKNVSCQFIVIDKG